MEYCILLCLLVCALPCCHCWSQTELDVFDLVEEVNENFYDLLQIKQDATTAEIKRAYRKLSLQYHPDKNRDDPSAAETFRKIGAVAEVLRDEESRRMYDSVLEHGLPDWRQPVYYYRRVRKMSLLELTVLLVTIIIIGQLLYGWAQYAEKQLVLYDLRQRKEKKDRKANKNRKNVPMQMTQLDKEVLYYEAMAKAALPHYTKLLPYVLVKKILQYSIVLLLLVVGVFQQKWRQSDKVNINEEEETRKEFELPLSDRRKSYAKQATSSEEERVNETVQESKLVGNGSITEISGKEEQQHEEDSETNSVEKEREEEQRQAKLAEREKEFQAELNQLEENMIEDEGDMKKKRRKKAHSSKIKSPLADKSLEYKHMYSSDEEPVTSEDKTRTISKKQVPTTSDTASEAALTGNYWSQNQQKQLEWALKQYGKECEDRWELIAEAVPDKTKEECVVRYRELVQLVRNKRLH